jgi:hypothetical protein
LDKRTIRDLWDSLNGESPSPFSSGHRGAGKLFIEELEEFSANVAESNFGLYSFSIDPNTNGAMIMKNTRGRELNGYLVMQPFAREVTQQDMWELSNIVCDYFSNKDSPLKEEV